MWASVSAQSGIRGERHDVGLVWVGADVDERFRPERHPMPQIFGIGSKSTEQNPLSF
jgi:hypothetical protein